jgi:hypothetical protein
MDLRTLCSSGGKTSATDQTDKHKETEVVQQSTSLESSYESKRLSTRSEQVGNGAKRIYEYLDIADQNDAPQNFHHSLPKSSGGALRSTLEGNL